MWCPYGSRSHVIGAIEQLQLLRRHRRNLVVFFFSRTRLAVLEPNLWCSSPVQDMRPVVLQTAFRHIDAARQSGRACLVHCQAGSSRSCSLVIGYLMQLDQGMSLLAALEFCQAKRPQVRGVGPERGWHQRPPRVSRAPSLPGIPVGVPPPVVRRRLPFAVAPSWALALRSRWRRPSLRRQKCSVAFPSKIRSAVEQAGPFRGRSRPSLASTGDTRPKHMDDDTSHGFLQSYQISHYPPFLSIYFFSLFLFICLP